MLVCGEDLEFWSGKGELLTGWQCSASLDHPRASLLAVQPIRSRSVAQAARLKQHGSSHPRASWQSLHVLVDVDHNVMMYKLLVSLSEGVGAGAGRAAISGECRWIGHDIPKSYQVFLT